MDEIKKTWTKGNILRRTRNSTNIKPYDGDAKYIALGCGAGWVNLHSDENNGTWFSKIPGNAIMYENNGEIKKGVVEYSMNLPNDEINICNKETNESMTIKRNKVVGYYMKDWIFETCPITLREVKLKKLLYG